VGHVHPEAVDPTVEPEPQHRDELGADLRVAPVQVRLGDVEQVQVPLAVRHAFPGRAAEDALPAVRRLAAVRAAAVAEDVALPLRAARCGGQGGAEPGMLVRRVVRHQVDDDLQAQRLRLTDHLVGVTEVAEAGIDRAVIGDVVTGVVLR
jgi:hypothetical protein